MAVYKKTGFKKVARKVKRAVGKAIKQRYYPKGKISYGNIYKDVSMLKKMINAEKKVYDVNIGAQVFGQLLGNTPGYHSNDITPVPPQGVGVSQRTGNSIKINSWHMTAQIIQQANATQAVNYKMYIFNIKGDPLVSPATFVTEHWLNNVFVGGGGTLVDYNSQINPVRFNDASLVYFKKFSIRPDTITGQVGFKTVSCGGKLQHHVRYDGGSTTVTSGQLVMVILADSGNCSPVTVSTLSNTPVQAINTGCTINYNLKWYYYDN